MTATVRSVIPFIVCLIVTSLTFPVSAEEPPSPAPEAPPALPSPPAGAEDPCKEIRNELARLKESKKLSRKRIPRSKRTSRRSRPARTHHPRTAQKATRTAQPNEPRSPSKDDPICTGALTKAAVDEILATTRDFSGKNLNCLDLTGYDLRRGTFTGATLIRTTLSRASLDEATLERADLSGATARNASFYLAGITGMITDGTVLDNALWVDRRSCAPPSIGLCRDTFQSPTTR